ncbi:MAG TPA: glycosyl hydrolase family 28-related protein [Acidobacteriaceae bacterium]|nr:glycosyl hydrolase family 28-related protein [Acidobacteriaceae bacterium]
MRFLLAIFALLFFAPAMQAQSLFSQRPVDAYAAYLERGSFGAVADGAADDTAAIQAAIDRVADTTGGGVVFIAEGRYRITHTVHLWSGIRLIGYGAHRPVFVLGAKTPGYQEGHEFLGTGRYMLQFASRRPSPGSDVVDANEFTFYSGINNVDFEIGNGNPAAIAIRFHVAQHSYLSHMNISVGQGRAGLEDVGNNASDLHITGGDYGIISVRTSPAWQFLLMDSTIEGQRKAAIHTQEVGMTLVRDRIAHTPVAIEITQGMVEQLYGRDLTLEDIRRTALVLGDVAKAHHEVTLDHVLCREVPTFVDGNVAIPAIRTLRAPAPRYVEEHLAIGLAIGPDGRERGVTMQHKESTAAAPEVKSDIPSLPSMAEWTNVHDLGVKGDGKADDTTALQAAIDGHRVLYFPTGSYKVSKTIQLRADSVLIGFNPSTAVITDPESDPAFAGEGDAIPLVQSAKGGDAIISGIGIDTGSVAPRAAGIVWMAGPHSMLDDVNFAAGHGRIGQTFGGGFRPQAGAQQRGPGTGPGGGGAGRASVAQGATPPQRPAGGFPRGPSTAETQYPSITVRDGGGGLLRGIWTSNTNAKAGLVVENTDTPTVVYQMSCEHHMHHETRFHNAANWTIYALQTEEENPAGADSFTAELVDSRNITFANLFTYRVSRNVKPKLNAVESTNSSGIRFENMHNFSMTRLAYDNSIFDASSGVRVRTHDFTSFEISAANKLGAPLPLPAAFAPGAHIEQLASGFSNASGLSTDSAGHLFFTDSLMHKVYRWNAETKQAELLTDQVPSPQAAGFVAPGTLLAIDLGKAVYSIDPQTGSVQKLSPAAAAEDGTSLLMPVGFHNSMDTLVKQMDRRGVVYARGSNMAITANVTDEHRDFFYAPGTKTAVMAGGTWQPMLQASQWSVMPIGGKRLASSEEDDTTYRLTLDSLNRITVSQFAPRGGSSVATDDAGNVYLAEGQVYIYNSAGKQLGVLEVPERPTSLAFGGEDHRTLFIGARGSLFSIRTQAAGH